MASYVVHDRISGGRTGSSTDIEINALVCGDDATFRTDPDRDAAEHSIESRGKLRPAHEPTREAVNEMFSPAMERIPMEYAVEVQRLLDERALQE
jgi:Fe-S cluster assembly scaffold protein SufB